MSTHIEPDLVQPGDGSFTGRGLTAPALGEDLSARPRAGRAAQALTFLLAAGLVLIYALRGGSYSLTARQLPGLICWWVLAAGLVAGVLPRRRPGRLVLVVLGALLSYGAWTALSLAWTQSQERTFEELARVLAYTGLFALVVSVLDRHTWRAAAGGLAAGAVTVCGLAVASRLHPGLVGVGGSTASAFGASRLSYPFGYWNAVGAWGSMTAALTVGWSAGDRRPLVRALSLGAAPLALATTYLTYSRAAAASVAIAALLLIAASRNRFTAALHCLAAGGAGLLVALAIHDHRAIADGTGTSGAGTILGTLVVASALSAVAGLVTHAAQTDRWRLPKRTAKVVGVAVAVISIAAGAAVLPGVASRAWRDFRNPRIDQTADPVARLTSLSGTRYQLWNVALHQSDRRPVLGTGAGTFEFTWSRNATEGEFVRNAHSVWLENLSELGWPGLLLIVAAAAGLLAVAGAARRAARRGASIAVTVALGTALAVYLVQASVDWMWQSTAVTALALSSAAVLATRSRRPHLRLGWRWRGPLAVLCVVLCAMEVPGLLSAAEISRSQAAVRHGDGATALAWAGAAVSTEPWAAGVFVQRGLVLEALNRLPEAEADLRRAISHEPTNFRHWLILARVQAERGAVGAAAADYGHALRLWPYATIALGARSVR